MWWGCITNQVIIEQPVYCCRWCMSASRICLLPFWVYCLFEWCWQLFVDTSFGCRKGLPCCPHPKKRIIRIHTIQMFIHMVVFILLTHNGAGRPTLDQQWWRWWWWSWHTNQTGVVFQSEGVVAHNLLPEVLAISRLMLGKWQSI